MFSNLLKRLTNICLSNSAYKGSKQNVYAIYKKNWNTSKLIVSLKCTIKSPIRSLKKYTYFKIIQIKPEVDIKKTGAQILNRQRNFVSYCGSKTCFVILQIVASGQCSHKQHFRK